MSEADVYIDNKVDTDIDTGIDTGRLPNEASAHALRRPFYFRGGDFGRGETGVLLVHGFTGTPYEMRVLGEGLADRGYTVYAPRLAGHGETAAAMAAATAADWVRTVDEAFSWLRARTQRVFVCGLSLGGLLTLELAHRRGEEIAAIEILSSPLWLTPPVETAIRWTRNLIAVIHRAGGRTPGFVIPKWAGSDIADPTTRLRNNLAQGAIGVPIPSVLELRAFMHEVQALLPQVKTPTLLMHSRLDHTAPYACLEALAGAIGSRALTVKSLERSFHVVTLDVEREQVIDAVAAHIVAHTGASHT